MNADPCGSGSTALMQLIAKTLLHKPNQMKHAFLINRVQNKHRETLLLLILQFFGGL